MRIDCDTCRARGPACDDCVVTVLLGSPTGNLEVDDTERQALETLAEAGLVPPLRLIHPDSAAS